MNEQAKETRKRNAEARRARREAEEAERQADKALILGALRAVLKDPEATTEQRLYAAIALDKVQYYNFMPTNREMDERLIEDFRKKLEAFQGGRIKLLTLFVDTFKFCTDKWR
ncbi:MAG: hypothetical protein NC489_45475 [Ruminococcus flavefaciens]|nr:hypothetical protein [Ruminococcus flavefaciens]